MPRRRRRGVARSSLPRRRRRDVAAIVTAASPRRRRRGVAAVVAAASPRRRRVVIATSSSRRRPVVAARVATVVRVKYDERVLPVDRLLEATQLVVKVGNHGGHLAAKVVVDVREPIGVGLRHLQRHVHEMHRPQQKQRPVVRRVRRDRDGLVSQQLLGVDAAFARRRLIKLRAPRPVRGVRGRAVRRRVETPEISHRGPVTFSRVPTIIVHGVVPVPEPRFVAAISRVVVGSRHPDVPFPHERRPVPHASQLRPNRSHVPRDALKAALGVARVADFGGRVLDVYVDRRPPRLQRAARRRAEFMHVEPVQLEPSRDPGVERGRHELRRRLGVVAHVAPTEVVREDVDDVGARRGRAVGARRRGRAETG